MKLDLPKMPAQEPTVNVQPADRSMETASTRLADGFDFPSENRMPKVITRRGDTVPGGIRARTGMEFAGATRIWGIRSTVLGTGVVVFARDVHLGWGNVVIVRHAYKEDGVVKHIDSLYGHLNSILGEARPKSRAGTADWDHGHGAWSIRRASAFGDSQEPGDRNEQIEVREEPEQLLRSEPIHRLTPASLWWWRQFPGGDEHLYA